MCNMFQAILRVESAGLWGVLICGKFSALKCLGPEPSYVICSAKTILYLSPNEIPRQGHHRMNLLCLFFQSASKFPVHMLRTLPPTLFSRFSMVKRNFYFCQKKIVSEPIHMHIAKIVLNNRAIKHTAEGDLFCFIFYS
ncbi:unnamed protein product [Kuraishia capsulata CBS 1993]|uniref:Uncharacterized protein n=1 Tax=Kuraishia capsulata CBS 1993 TaxID=1382522 RepID=W6MW20_9ASCO|nr:uncharacterized protein KUCA_T00002774001 [Kuraishia capsulata CBS 1993]CDK26800.1 unnamed protein product [Kuraishia capsulata CBS 1993]